MAWILVENGSSTATTTTTTSSIFAGEMMMVPLHDDDAPWVSEIDSVLCPYELRQEVRGGRQVEEVVTKTGGPCEARATRPLARTGSRLVQQVVVVLFGASYYSIIFSARPEAFGRRNKTHRGLSK